MLHQLLELLPLLVDVELGVPESVHQHSIIHLVQHHLSVQLRAEPAGSETASPPAGHRHGGDQARACQAGHSHQAAPTATVLAGPWSVRLAEQTPSPSFKAQVHSRLSHSEAGQDAHPKGPCHTTPPKPPLTSPDQACWVPQLLCRARARSILSPRRVQGAALGRRASGGMPFGMTHATARSEVRGIKIGLCKRAERKLLPEIGDIRHLTPGPGTIHSWAICVSALQEKQARSYSLAALPLPTTGFPGTMSNCTSPRGKIKTRSKGILDGTARHQELGSFSLFLL